MKTLLFILIFSPSLIYIDPIGYSEEVQLKVESTNYIIIHYHNWKESTRKSRYKMISTDQNPFTPLNDYAYILCINKTTKDTVFKSPSPALSKILISDDEKFIVGISNIKMWNPYQFVLFNTSGTLIKKKHITPNEAKLSSSHFEKFKIEFPKQHAYLKNNDRIYKKENTFFIDFISMDMPRKLGEAWNFLFKFYSPNHLSKNFSQSTSNWIYWYKENNPKITFEYENENLKYVSILDPKGNKINIEK
jgi:hypothetical protein